MRVLCINCKPDLSYFTKRGLNLQITYSSIPNKIYPLNFLYKIKDQGGNMVDVYTPWVEEDLKKYEGYAIILVGWKPEDYDDKVKNTGGYSYWKALPSGAFWCTVRQDKTPNNNYAIHEIHHALCNIIFKLGHHVLDSMDVTNVNGIMIPYYLNDQPENTLSNYAVTWNAIKPFLSELNTYNLSPMYKYFKPNEIVGLKPELVKLLDDARHIAGIPFKLNSGYRTKEQNKKAGGVPDSAHLTGLAVDIACTTDSARHKIIDALQKVGFNRIGISKNFVHCDLDKTKSPNVIWLYD